MTTANTPQPIDTAVPSAAAERRRIWRGDSIGIAAYVIASVAFSLAALVIVLLTR